MLAIFSSARPCSPHPEASSPFCLLSFQHFQPPSSPLRSSGALGLPGHAMPSSRSTDLRVAVPGESHSPSGATENIHGLAASDGGCISTMKRIWSPSAFPRLAPLAAPRPRRTRLVLLLRLLLRRRHRASASRIRSRRMGRAPPPGGRSCCGGGGGPRRSPRRTSAATPATRRPPGPGRRGPALLVAAGRRRRPTQGRGGGPRRRLAGQGGGVAGGGGGSSSVHLLLLQLLLEGGGGDKGGEDELPLLAAELEVQHREAVGCTERARRFVCV